MKSIYLEGVEFGKVNTPHHDNLSLYGVDLRLIGINSDLALTDKTFEYREYPRSKEPLRSCLYKILSKLLFTDEDGRYCIIGAGKRVNVDSYSKRIVITKIKLKPVDEFVAGLFTRQKPVIIDRKLLLITKYYKEISNGDESSKQNNLHFNDLDDENIIKFYEKIKDPQTQSFYAGLIERLKWIISTSRHSFYGFKSIADKHLYAYIKKSLNQIYPYNY